MINFSVGKSKFTRGFRIYPAVTRNVDVYVDNTLVEREKYVYQVPVNQQATIVLRPWGMNGEALTGKTIQLAEYIGKLKNYIAAFTESSPGVYETQISQSEEASKTYNISIEGMTVHPNADTIRIVFE